MIASPRGRQMFPRTTALKWSRLPRSPTDLPVASPSDEANATQQGLCSAVARDTRELRAALARAGALLLRGWGVRDESEFQRAVLALGFEPLSDYFPTEAGRRPFRRRGCEYVWPTNSLRQTGAYLSPEVLPHTENYYAVQTPRYVCFWCERTAWLGGDTCLIDGPAVFAELPSTLQRLLSFRAFRIRRVVSLQTLAQVYGVHGGSLDAFCARCERNGVRARPHPDRPSEYLLFEFQKPSVWRTRDDRGRMRTSVALNFGECGVAAREALLGGLLERGFFSGPQWAVHRALWALARVLPWFRLLLAHIDALCLLVLNAWRGFSERRNPPPPANAESTLGVALTLKQQQQLGRVLASLTYAFRWQPGDVLILDNSQVLECKICSRREWNHGASPFAFTLHTSIPSRSTSQWMCCSAGVAPLPPMPRLPTGRAYAFRWQPGDVLILDNSQVRASETTTPGVSHFYLARFNVSSFQCMCYSSVAVSSQVCNK
jgi:alpha-ketoglutarate-dependent taurine dioxygenase